MSDLDRIVRELVIANRILANENVVRRLRSREPPPPDDPGRYLLARSVAPEPVERSDIVEFTLDGPPTREEKRAIYEDRLGRITKQGIGHHAPACANRWIVEPCLGTAAFPASEGRELSCRIVNDRRSIAESL